MANLGSSIHICMIKLYDSTHCMIKLIQVSSYGTFHQTRSGQSPWGWESSCLCAPKGLGGGTDGAVLWLGTDGAVLRLGAVSSVGRCSGVRRCSNMGRCSGMGRYSDVGWCSGVGRWTEWGDAPAARGEGLARG